MTGETEKFLVEERKVVKQTHELGRSKSVKCTSAPNFRNTFHYLYPSSLPLDTFIIANSN
jgi:hypothetical protein